MSDFTPVTLVKGEHEYVAHTPAELVNAQFGLGYAVAAPQPSVEDAAGEAAEKAPAPTPKRSTGRAATEGASA
ncbi:hypothetical protein GS982_20320 [Rhodococcus hoagii]|nr:hypothetical protein [Prescottella equi]NKZ84540.1 hypothetical protein [Prescottella equi]